MVSGLRALRDSTNWQAIDPNTELVAGYVPPSRFAWPPQAAARFPNSTLIWITPSASVARRGVAVLDVEQGDASPDQVPGWCVASRTAGQEPTAYMNWSTWAAVIRACTGAGVAVPQFWVALWNGQQDLPTVTVDGVTYTAVAHQYANPPLSGGDWDASVAAPFWPGVDQVGDDMGFDLDTPLDASGNLNWPGTTNEVTVRDALRTSWELVYDSKGNPGGQTVFDAIWAGTADVEAVKAAVAAGQPVTLSDTQLTDLEAKIAAALPGYDVSIMPKTQTPA